MPSGFPQLARRKNEAAEQKRCGVRRNREGSRTHRPPPRTKPGTPDFCSLSFFFPRRERRRIEPSGLLSLQSLEGGGLCSLSRLASPGKPEAEQGPQRERKGTTRQPQRASPLKLILHHGPEKEAPPFAAPLTFASFPLREVCQPNTGEAL